MPYEKKVNIKCHDVQKEKKFSLLLPVLVVFAVAKRFNAAFLQKTFM